jgi:hypothetical protein
MSLMAEALRSLMVNGIFAVDGRLDLMTLPDAIVSPHAAYDIDFDDQTKSILLDFRGGGFIADATAADCCRLATYSLQSAKTVKTEITEKSTMPWGLIKLYYSAFYAAHTTVRLLGQGCSYFDSRHMSRISEFAQAVSKAPSSFRLERGLYRCSVNAAATQLKCTKLGGSDGGTHESFWDIFAKTIRATRDNILMGPMLPADAQAVFAKLDEFDDLFLRHGSVSWLSKARNEIQYRHGHDAWFKSAIQKNDRDTLGRLASRWEDDPMDFDLNTERFGLLGEFATACAFIIALCRVLVIQIDERLPKKSKSFLRFGPLAFLNDEKLSATSRP